MLFADKNALRTQLKCNMLKIRERELAYYGNNCLSISTSAALLAGFAWYGLTEVPFEASAPFMTQTLYLTVTTCIMGLELLTVVNSTMCGILGPGLALRGPDGSMHNAVNGMMLHYRYTFACFTGGLLGFMVSSLLYAWMQFDFTLAAPVSLLLFYFLALLVRDFGRIYRRFRLTTGAAVTGAFHEMQQGETASSTHVGATSGGWSEHQDSKPEAVVSEMARRSQASEEHLAAQATPRGETHARRRDDDEVNAEAREGEGHEALRQYRHLPESVRADTVMGGWAS